MAASRSTAAAAAAAAAEGAAEHEEDTTGATVQMNFEENKTIENTNRKRSELKTKAIKERNRLGSILDQI
jgi:hypothetical protein